MSDFRRRIMAQSRPAITDWDYEWSYLSGELPYDLRFIKSKTDNVYLTDEGLKFDGINANLTLVDHDRLLFYMKLVNEYRTGNDSRGFHINFQNKSGDTEKSSVFCSYETMTFQTMPESFGAVYGTFKFGELLEFVMNVDFTDLSRCYVDFKGKRTYNTGKKNSWLNRKSLLETDNGIHGSEGYVLVKELKFKAYD